MKPSDFPIFTLRMFISALRTSGRFHMRIIFVLLFIGPLSLFAQSLDMPGGTIYIPGYPGPWKWTASTLSSTGANTYSNMEFQATPGGTNYDFYGSTTFTPGLISFDNGYGDSGFLATGQKHAFLRGNTYTCYLWTLDGVRPNFVLGQGYKLIIPDIFAPIDDKKLPTKGEPVQLATGFESRHSTLFKFSGARDWDFSVTYNAHFAATQPFNGNDRFGLGRGWTHNFEAHVLPFETSTDPAVLFGPEIAVQTSPTVALKDQRVIYWDRYHYSVASGVAPSVYRLTGDIGQFDALVHQSDGTWLLNRSDQSSLLFNASGKLIEDRPQEIPLEGRYWHLQYR